jgi:hypothetical protein
MIEVLDSLRPREKQKIIRMIKAREIYFSGEKKIFLYSEEGRGEF